jgi:hypothetical protein
VERAVDRGEERLEQPFRLDSDGGGDGQGVVALAYLDALVRVEPMLDGRGPRSQASHAQL